MKEPFSKIKEVVKMDGTKVGSSMIIMESDTGAAQNCIRPSSSYIRQRLIIWDGQEETEYVENEFAEDVMLVPKDSAMGPHLVPVAGIPPVDDEILLVSVDRMRRKAVKFNVDPIIVFGCKPNKKTTERRFLGKWNGLFTKCFTNSEGFRPRQTLRELIADTNKRLARLSSQRCEVICSVDRLKRTWLPKSESNMYFHFSGHGAENTDMENPRLREYKLDFNKFNSLYVTLDMCRV